MTHCRASTMSPVCDAPGCVPSAWPGIGARGGSVHAMNKNLRVGSGILLVLMGMIWTMQGLGVLQSSSPMTGVTFWAIAGPVAALIGLALALGRVGRRTP